ncbi:hypothetical protein CCHR01_19768 [Colletotrichum chrysophilum]|uniref:Uncharacterized protein n=1 Tax=Colletotrichum chrysophilum TaxID=1836956 RepID=A0AAD8ZZ30_9PEZI|nr:hypothetical protein CCHR01_19768 [Colletotrichum chrysophilum]
MHLIHLLPHIPMSDSSKNTPTFPSITIIIIMMD